MKDILIALILAGIVIVIQIQINLIVENIKHYVNKIVTKIDELEKEITERRNL